MIQPQITLQSYLHSETFNLGRHLEVMCNARYRFLDHWRTTFKRCSQSIASVRLLRPFRMSDFRKIAFALHLEHVSGIRNCSISALGREKCQCSVWSNFRVFSMHARRTRAYGYRYTDLQFRHPGAITVKLTMIQLTTWHASWIHTCTQLHWNAFCRYDVRAMRVA